MERQIERAAVSRFALLSPPLTFCKDSLLFLLICLVFVYETGSHCEVLADQAALKFMAVCCLYLLHVGITRVGMGLSPPVKIKLEIQEKEKTLIDESLSCYVI